MPYLKINVQTTERVSAVISPMIIDMKILQNILLAACMFLIIATMNGCGDDNPVNSFIPDVSNTEDIFTFRVNNAYIVTETLTYSWNNTGDQASIYHSSARSGGTATLVIFDSDGTQVYSDDLKVSGVTEATQVGNPGTWRVVVDFKEYSGSAYFKLEKL